MVSIELFWTYHNNYVYFALSFVDKSKFVIFSNRSTKVVLFSKNGQSITNESRYVWHRYVHNEETSMKMVVYANTLIEKIQQQNNEKNDINVLKYVRKCLKELCWKLIFDSEYPLECWPHLLEAYEQFTC